MWISDRLLSSNMGGALSITGTEQSSVLGKLEFHAGKNQVRHIDDTQKSVKKEIQHYTKPKIITLLRSRCNI